MTSAKVDTLRDTASDAWEQVQRARAPTTAGLSKGLIGCAKKNPLTALLLAAGAGAIVFGASRILQSHR